MDAFAALADPTRRNILTMLGAGARSAGEIAAGFAISPPAISQHLKALREARLIQVRTDAQRRIYSIDPAGLREVDRWLNQYRSFWNSKLDKLEERLRAEDPAHRSSPEPTPSNNSARQRKSTRRKGKKL
jgi:DNA-binding transcriptional ArsR family regulator